MRSRKTKLALVTSANLETCTFVPGDFSLAWRWHKETTEAGVIRWFRNHPNTPCRMPTKVARNLFGLTKAQLWHDDDD